MVVCTDALFIVGCRTAAICIWCRPSNVQSDSQLGSAARNVHGVCEKSAISFCCLKRRVLGDRLVLLAYSGRRLQSLYR